jgi:UDP-N-acetylenolpyruvoylglucosamine reductase
VPAPTSTSATASLCAVHQVVVLHADLGLARRPSRRGEAEIAEIVRWRRAHQPGGANAGSVFTNPPGRLAPAG